MSNLPSALSKPSMVARMPGAPEVLESRIALSTFLVTTLADTSDAANDTGSLRDALFNAANHPGPDIIKFAPNLAGTITLTNGALPLILDPLTITGPGPGKISIDARHNSGIFVISDGTPSTDSPVTISGLSLLNGKVTSGGGAINSEESLTLSNCIISGCLAPNGGGVAVYAGDTTGSFCKIINSQFIQNQTTAMTAGTGGGGAVIFTQKSAIISGSVFFSNFIGYHGGGNGGGANINVTGAAAGSGINLTGDFFSNNSASVGGGLSLSSNHPIGITSSTFEKNSSYSAAGAYVLAPANSLGGITISKSLVSANQADGSGGGLLLMDLNQSRTGSGAPQSRITLSSSVISGNTAVGATSDAGGVDIPTGFAYLLSDQIHGNSAGNNGGGVNATPSSLTITGGSISNNLASGSTNGGGGLFAIVLQTSLNHVQFADNRAPNGGGGGADISGGIANIIGASFVSNSAESVGGLALSVTSNVNISSTSIADNMTTLSFGGFFVIAPTAHTVIKNSSITGNISQSGTGGGLFYSATVQASNITVSGNVAADTIGGIGFGGPSVVTLQNSKIFDNFAGNNGGGIFFAPTVSAGSSITNTPITGNISGDTGGGIFNQSGSNVQISVAELALITGNIAKTSPDIGI